MVFNLRLGLKYIRRRAGFTLFAWAIALSFAQLLLKKATSGVQPLAQLYVSTMVIFGS